MGKIYENQTITQEAFLEAGMYGIEYFECTIERCNLFEQELNDCIFSNCIFKNCDLSMCKLTNTQMNDIKFENCKIMGVDFSRCPGFLFEVNFVDCILDFCSFEKLKMANTSFRKCSMKGVDLVGTQLQNTLFDQVNLEEATFSNTNLKEANLSTAYNFIISPTQNNIKKAVFSENNLSGLLHEFSISIV
ncbi:pentapeptide repeat-containing protein [Dysgonomonas sp. HGC4]|uniref:pentapeptide repeat-containing protein n=1 Tax=Dysgonomonas sp. HGC4 TaxID=1658009 RepID=UPI0006802B94|nr:pentapeptide repeat-containing protein [Dysgonomonas sp. HGC4]MBD8348529.1 pentapeptide repeat-containing protein [Dysgonomonas sp. HGC4]